MIAHTIFGLQVGEKRFSLDTVQSFEDRHRLIAFLTTYLRASSAKYKFVVSTYTRMEAMSAFLYM